MGYLAQNRIQFDRSFIWSIRVTESNLFDGRFFKSQWVYLLPNPIFLNFSGGRICKTEIFDRGIVTSETCESNASCVANVSISRLMAVLTCHESLIHLINLIFCECI